MLFWWIFIKNIGISLGALQSVWSKVCIFAFFEHFRALPEHLRKHWEFFQMIDILVKIFIRGTASLRRRYSWSARRCSPSFKNVKYKSRAFKLANLEDFWTQNYWDMKFWNEPFPPLWLRKSGFVSSWDPESSKFQKTFWSGWITN